MTDSELRPPKLAIRQEFRHVIGDLLRLPLTVRRLKTMPRGRGEPVLVVPGLLTGDESTLVFRRALKKLGYVPYGWNNGLNYGRVEQNIPHVMERIAEVQALHGGKITVIGFSLGGVLARMATRRAPELVERVITVASPLAGGAKYAAAKPYFKHVLRTDVEVLGARADEENALKIGVPVTALICRNDSWVSPAACVDRSPTDVRHIEVGGSHLTLAYREEVYRIVAGELHRVMPAA